MSPHRDDPARLRAAQRHSWPVHKYQLGSDPSDDLSDQTTVEQRLEMMWPLALEAWSLTGRLMPDYVRHETPILRFRREDLVRNKRALGRPKDLADLDVLTRE